MKISAKTKLYWLNTFERWANERLSPHQYYEARQVLVDAGLLTNDDENIVDLIISSKPCHCPCHEHPGTYPTSLHDPCHMCGHTNSDGYLAGHNLGWYQQQ